jgi:hypothetical protein
VIDDDLGISGAQSSNRPGYQRLVSMLALREVAIVFGLEFSRLARNCLDWYQLLELAAAFNVLIGDEDGLYDPADFNDRLLLGLKGTFSEIERYQITARMQRGRLNKARRGEYAKPVPIGYAYDPMTGQLELSPDQAVRHLTWGLQRDLVSFYSERQGVVSRVMATTKKLQCIVETARYGAEFGGVSEANITMRLLVGAPLASGNESTRWVTNPIGTRTISASTLDPDIAAWKAAIDSLKLKPRDRKLLFFVAALEDSGALPPAAPGRQGQNAGVRRYWTDVLRRWNLQCTDEDWLYAHWTSLRRYEQMTAHLPERPRP